MRSKDFITEAASVVKLYHVTRTETVPRIQEKGITGANPTNFTKASGGQYGNIGEIFCMTSKKDATRWAAQWEWQLANKLGPQVGELSVFPSSFPTGKVMVVNTINVHEKYRGMGIAKALYGIVLSELKMPLMSGDSQTPGGMRNWVSLNKIPGVKVRGYLKVGKYYIEESPPEEKAKLRADLELLNDEYVGTTGSKNHGYHCWLFDVAPNQTGTELAALAKTKIIKVYADSNWSFDVGLIASWGRVI